MNLQRIAQSPHKRTFGLGVATGGLIASLAAVAMVPSKEPPKVHVLPLSIPAPFFFPYTPEQDPEPPSATSPQLRGECIDHVGDNEAICEWDDGFPAISRDGTTIVVKHEASSDVTWPYSVTIQFIDVATSSVTSQAKITNIDLVSIYDDDGQSKQAKRVAKEAAVIQKKIDAIGFRSLTKPSEWDMQQEGGHVRLVDTKTNATVFQTEYTPPKKLPDVAYFEFEWDAETKTLFSEVTLCDSPSEGAHCEPRYLVRKL